MIKIQQDKILQTHRLILDKKRFYKHFEAPIYIGIPSLVALFFIVKLFLDKSIHFVPSMFLLFLLPMMSVATFLNQYFALNMRQIDTSFNKLENHDLILQTLTTLEWIIKINDNGFIEAFNPFGDIRTWGREMVSFVFDDKRILINSICNVDQIRSQAMFSFGKNKQNVKKFIKAFEINSITAQ